MMPRLKRRRQCHYIPEKLEMHPLFNFEWRSARLTTDCQNPLLWCNSLETLRNLQALHMVYQTIWQSKPSLKLSLSNALHDHSFGVIFTT